MEAIIQQYGIWALLGYMIVKDGIPMLGKVINRVLPMREKRLAEAEAHRQDLEERTIVAQEMIGKQLAISNQNYAVANERILKLEGVSQAMMTALISTNQSLAVLLDRSTHRRKDIANPE